MTETIASPVSREYFPRSSRSGTLHPHLPPPAPALSPQRPGHPPHGKHRPASPAHGMAQISSTAFGYRPPGSSPERLLAPFDHFSIRGLAFRIASICRSFSFVPGALTLSWPGTNSFPLGPRDACTRVPGGPAVTGTPRPHRSPHKGRRPPSPQRPRSEAPQRPRPRIIKIPGFLLGL